MFNIFSKKNSKNSNNDDADIQPRNFSNEVDPVAEADVYWSFGRETQARKILEEAYATGDSILQNRIDKYLSEKDGTLNKISLNKTKPTENFQYRVHCVKYMNSYSHVYKFFINCKYPKNSKNGIEEIENYIEKNYIQDNSNWSITFISEKLD